MRTGPVSFQGEHRLVREILQPALSTYRTCKRFEAQSLVMAEQELAAAQVYHNEQRGAVGREAAATCLLCTPTWIGHSVLGRGLLVLSGFR